MNIIIIGDTHIKESALIELEDIFTEIYGYIQQGDMIVQLGDWFDSVHVTPKELDFSAKWITSFLSKTPDLYIMEGTGKHDNYNQESIITHFKYFGVHARPSTFQYGENYILFGHWLVQESKYAFDKQKYSIKDLKDKFQYIFLGHQHSYESLSDNGFHLGSVRYIHFGESQDELKYITIIHNGYTICNKLNFVPLKSPIPMKDCYSCEELDNLDKRYKTRLIISSMEEHKQYIANLKRYKEKFVELGMPIIQYKLETVEKGQEITTKKLDNDKLIQSYINKVEDIEIKELLRKTYEDSNN